MSRKVGTPGLLLSAAVTATLLVAPLASAHQDPPGCFETGPAIIVSVFRANGTTGVVGNVSECETINYRARLQKAADVDTICAFSGGTFRLTTPDGIVHDISLDVPCIGGTDSAEGCTAALDFIESPLIPYTVDPVDVVGGLISATAVYTGGVAHDQPGNTAGVGANTPKSTPVTFCADNDLCTIDACDPNVPGSAACSNTPIVCDDNTVCTTDQCVEGLCIFTPIDCDDENVCTTDSCDPVLGCQHDPITCNDNDPCTTDTCNPVTGCVFTPGALDCDDNDVCTSDACVAGVGCVNTPGALNCNDNDPCTTDRCDPLLGCVNTPGALNCNDNDPCTSDACVAGVGCVNTPGALNCDDNNGCTDDACVAGQGCVNTPKPPCDDNDECTDDSCNPQTGQCEFVDNGSCVFSGCRVTGGGKVDACGPVPAGCDPSTGDCAPNCDPAALNATHGGQVGAPIGTPTPFSPDSVCIQGEWTHVRHIRPGLFGNFHASTFDSLMCACLPCAENPDAEGVIGALCNPGDRICGPEPRRAPDNKICFSGVGKYAETKGRRADRAVIFRTDVEDRSEPGGGTADDPPDRYRLRLWFVDGLGDPDDPSSDAYALRQAVACANPTTEAVMAPTPDIDDGGDMIHGNHQIHPSLDKTCEQ